MIASRFRFPQAWSRRPRRTARLRLTALYGGLFLVSGAALLAITYVLFERATRVGGPNPIGGAHSFRPTAGSSPASPTTQQLQHLTVEQAARAAQLVSDRHQLVVNAAIALAIVAALAIGLGWIVAGRVLRPARTITATARRISASRLHERLALDDADEEFRQLGDTLNDLFIRLEAAFDAQRHFVANASHELRTPLTRERTLLQVSLEDPSTSDLWRSTGQELLASNREQEDLVEALLALASSESGLDQCEQIDLAAISYDLLLRCNLAERRDGLQVESSLQPAVVVGDLRLVERLVANLVDNAIKHNIVGGSIKVCTAADDGKAVISVSNSGPTIPLNDVDRLFQPFQRRDPGRTHRPDGHGLGLSIVRAIADAHGATIAARPGPRGGLSIDISFPQAAFPSPSGFLPRPR